MTACYHSVMLVCDLHGGKARAVYTVRALRVGCSINRGSAVVVSELLVCCVFFIHGKRFDKNKGLGLKM
jgi:hypothetical protein